MSKKEITVEQPVELNIPEDEIWTYRVEGLSAPHINKPYKHFGIKKVIFTLVIIVAVSLSCYFSVRTVNKDTFEYKTVQNGFELSKFSNTGYITSLDIDFVSNIEYDSTDSNPSTNFAVVKDETRKVTSVGDYALNCDEKIKVINIGANVENIASKAFYSCWALERIEVDENNPNYCDIDGVLYTKDKSRIICRPCNHNAYLCEKYGYAKYDESGNMIDVTQDDENYESYVNDVLTFVVPSTVKTIGELSFNYANIQTLYLPEGLETIETLGFFKSVNLKNIYSYKTDGIVSESHFTAEAALGTIYKSLPEGLKYIGSDAFSYNQEMTYVFIPESVTFIGHHAFWDTVYKNGKELCGVTVINTPLSNEEFNEKVDTGNNWKPQYDYMLFKKSIDVAYDSQREQ